MSATAINPKTLDAKAIPRLWNIGLTKRGKTAANILRRKVFAAIALAEYLANVSIR